MNEAVPVIYAPPTRRVRITFHARLITAGLFVACAVLIYTAWRLTPSPEGIGTHTEMGYLGCSMLMTTGYPCPTCGMTTSFAWFYRGNLAASFYIQPAGFVAAYLVGMLLLLTLYQGISGRPIHRLLRFFPGKWMLILGGALFVLGWGWKIFIHRAGMDGWG